AHFLSDVVFAGLIVCGVSWLLAWALLKRDISGTLWRRLVGRLGPSGAVWALYAVLSLIAIAACIAYVDRPVALYFHGASPPVAGGFRGVTPFGAPTSHSHAR